MAATGKSTVGSSVTAAAGAVPPAEGVKPKEAAKPAPAARRPEPDLEALEQGKPADMDCLEIARKSKWRGRCITSTIAVSICVWALSTSRCACPVPQQSYLTVHAIPVQSQCDIFCKVAEHANCRITYHLHT